MSISPKQIAILTWSNLDTYINIPEASVDSLNRRIRVYSDEYFVVRCNFTKEILFDFGKPPDDYDDK